MKQLSYTILYEDSDLLLVNKPAGLLTIPDRYSNNKPSLIKLLTQKYGEVLVVHRLDRDTSGVICFARNKTAHQQLSLQFEQREVQKFYHALVEGQPIQEAGTIEKPIASSPNKPGKMVVHKNGKPALSTYKVLEKFRGYSWLEVQIHTGRTHQIRVHLQSIGYPLVVDETYGNRSGLYLSAIKQRKFRLGKDQEERPILHRVPLHASRLVITQPSTQSRLETVAPFPKDLKAILNQLRKWRSLA